MPQVLVTHNEHGFCPLCNVYYEMFSMDFGSARAFSIFILMIQRLASARLADNSMSDDSSGGGIGSRPNRKNKQTQNKHTVVAGGGQSAVEAEVPIFCRGGEFHPLSRGIIRLHSHGGELHPLSRGIIHMLCTAHASYVVSTLTFVFPCN